MLFSPHRPQCLPHLELELGKRGYQERDDEVWTRPRTELRLAAFSEHVSFAERNHTDQYLITNCSSILHAARRFWIADYCDEPGNVFRAALSYLIYLRAHLRQLPGTLCSTESLSATAHLDTFFRRYNHGNRSFAQGPRWSPPAPG
jgi:hypothetical protein